MAVDARREGRQFLIALDKVWIMPCSRTNGETSTRETENFKFHGEHDQDSDRACPG
jgi:hypothetical protein